MKKLLAIASSLLVMGVSGVTVTAFADTGHSGVTSVSQKQISLNGGPVSSPMGFVHDGTTYMPIYYVQQVLNKLDIHNTWDGKTWNISAPDTMQADYRNVGNPGAPYTIQVNGHFVYSVSGVPYQGPSDSQPTMYMPIWYVQQVLHRLYIQDSWDGQHWSITYAPSSSDAVHWTPGVVPGIHTSGNAKQSWFNGSGIIHMNSESYDPLQNKFPIDGHISDANQGDVVVAVMDTPDFSQVWHYSVPIKPDGSFSDTIVLPFSGHLAVTVGRLQQTGENLVPIPGHFAMTDVTNVQPALADTDMALLQSWLVNYNEDDNLSQTATQIATSTGMDLNPNSRTQDAADKVIQAVSDYVSKNVQYNFPAYTTNTIPWQQVTDTYHLHVGVCQDESALVAALLRSMDIPTRTVRGFGSIDGQSGSHQWNEAWDGNRWIIFDPTWDQNYASATSISYPDSTSFDWFDIPPAVYDEHYTEDPQPYEW